MATPFPERLRIRGRAASAALLLVLLVVAPAGAQSTDPVELAQQAIDDPASLEALRELSPDARTALTGTEDDVAERLETLATQERFEVDEDVSAIAQDILSQERFATARDNTVGSLIADLQRRLTIWINRLIASIIANVPGGPRLFFGALILGVLAMAGVFASRLAQNRIRVTEAATLARIRRERGLSPAELRRRSREAAQAGDHAEAVRLLFLAGLTTLDERDRIDFSPGTTTEEISEHLTSSTFDDLASRFNEVVYGGRDADADDYDRSLAEWNAVLEAS